MNPATTPASILRMKTAIDHDTVKFIELGMKTSLNFTANIRNFPTFAAAMDRIGGCNNFNPDELVDTFAELFGSATHVEFGVESTPVLYVTLPFFQHQRLDATPGTEHTQYTSEQRQTLAQHIIDWAREMKADKITVKQQGHRTENTIGEPGDNPSRIRIWWD